MVMAGKASGWYGNAGVELKLSAHHNKSARVLQAAKLE
jgi:hypothetical protein